MNCREVAELAPMFLAGEMDAEGRVAIEAHADRCPECAEMLEQHAWIDARLREALDTAEPDTTALDRAVLRRIAAGGPRRWLIPAAAAVLAVAGLFLAQAVLPHAGPSRLYTDAARDHHREVVDRQPRHWRVTAAEIDGVAERMGFRASEAAALAPQGYRLEHAKTCGLEGRQVLHLVYTNGTEEFSVYLLQGQVEPKEVTAGAENIAAFQGNRFAALVVTDSSGEECRELAAALSRKL